MYAKDSYEAKYQYLIKIHEKVDVDHHNDPRTYNEYSNDMRDVYKNINDYNPYNENKIFIFFDDMIADMINIKKLDSVVTELFIRGRKFNISLVLSRNHILRFQKMLENTTHFFIRKVPNRRELQETARNHSSDIKTEDFNNIYTECTAEPYSFLVNDTMLASDNPLRFGKLFLIYNKSHDQKKKLMNRLEMRNYNMILLILL